MSVEEGLIDKKAVKDQKQQEKLDNDEKKFDAENNRHEDREAWLLNVPGWFKGQGMKPDKEAIDIAKAKTDEARKIWKSQDQLNKEGSDIEDHSVGPALLLTFYANRITWIFFTTLPWIVGCNWVFLGGSIISCAEPAAEGGTPLPFATYPKTLWLFFFSVTGILLHYEMRAFKHVSVSQVVVAGIPKLAGCQLSYSKFLYVMLLISLIYHMDIFTNGIFIARVLVTDRCVAAGNFTVTPERIWHDTISHSALRSLNGLSFFAWCVAAWLSLYLQPIYSYFFALPRSPQLQDALPKRPLFSEGGKKDLPPVDYETKGEKSDCPRYAVILRGDQQHGRALQAMSESARMNSLYFMDPEYLHYQTKSWKPTDVHREMQRTNVRFFIFIVETMLPPNLQATFLCFEKAMSYNPQEPDAEGFKDYIILFSTILSFVTGMIYVRSELTAVFKFDKLVKDQHWKFGKWAESNPEDLNREDLHRADDALEKAFRSKIICLFLAFTGLFFLSYAVVKAIMGTFYCPMGMWNLRLPNLVDGCVNLAEHGLYH